MSIRRIAAAAITAVAAGGLSFGFVSATTVHAKPAHFYETKAPAHIYEARHFYETKAPSIHTNIYGD